MDKKGDRLLFEFVFQKVACPLFCSVLFAAVYFAGILALNADVIYLKSGKKVEGRIAGYMDNLVVVEYGNGDSDTFPESDILKIQSGVSLEQNEKPQEAPPPGMIEIPLTPPQEFDFKSVQEISQWRQKAVWAHIELLEGSKVPEIVKPGFFESFGKMMEKKPLEGYKPSMRVFGRLKNEKAWWGTLGISYYGPGLKSIEGPSEESRFILNPFLFAGLDDVTFHTVPSETNLKPVEIYPEPLRLYWNKEKGEAIVRYDVSRFWQKQAGYHYEVHEHGSKFRLAAYNAVDLGYFCFYIDPEKSKNVSARLQGKAVMIDQFLDRDERCEYSGGCNDMVSKTPELDIEITALPATAVVKFWKRNPKDVSQPADMTFTLEMV